MKRVYSTAIYDDLEQQPDIKTYQESPVPKLKEDEEEKNSETEIQLQIDEDDDSMRLTRLDNTIDNNWESYNFEVSEKV